MGNTQARSKQVATVPAAPPQAPVVAPLPAVTPVPTATVSDPAAPASLLPFCEYLSLRLKGDNVELLSRIVSEFQQQPPSFSTVESMLHLGFPLITLLPVENDDPAQLSQADAILEQRCEPGAANAFEDLRKALDQRIKTKNWDWLAQVYLDFCAGDEYCLLEFVRLQRQAISVIPTAPTITAVGGPLNTPYSTEESKPVMPAEVKASLTPKFLTLNKKTPLSMAKRSLRDRLYQEYHTVEIAKPWETVFDVSKIEYPFDADKYPYLAEKLKAFWQKHAIAVWERDRWSRSSSNPNDDRIERKWRQERASRIFELWVIVPVFKTLGAQFFVEFDKRPERHHWWFYMGPVVDLLTMGLTLGEATAVTYLKSTCLERFPQPPPGMILSRQRSGNDGWSMFSTKPKFEYIRKAIATAKHADAETAAAQGAN